MQVQEKYDIIILGTGIVESILSALLSENSKKKILIIDRTALYGGQSTTLNLKQFYSQYLTDKSIPSSFGNSQNWNININLKVAFCEDRLTKLLLHTKTASYVDWRTINATFGCAYRERSLFKKGLRIYRIPSKPRQGMFSDLMGMLEKRRIHRFLDNMMNLEVGNKSTHGEIKVDKNVRQNYDIFELEQKKTRTLIAHVLAGYEDERYHEHDIKEMAKRLQLYRKSMLTQFGTTPYIYPSYGLGSLSEAFVRRVPLNQGKIKLQTHVSQFLVKNNKVEGIKTTDGKSYYAPTIICDPSYAENCGYKDYIYVKEKIIRCVCILDHEIAQIKEIQKQYHSGFMTIPNKTNRTKETEINRKTNMYLLYLSNAHKVCEKKYFVVVIVAKMEKLSPQRTLQYPLSLLGDIREKFIQIFERYVPYGSQDDGWEEPQPIIKTQPQNPAQDKKQEKQQQKQKYQNIIEEDEQQMLQIGQEPKKFNQKKFQKKKSEEQKKQKQQKLSNPQNPIQEIKQEQYPQQQKPILKPPQNPIEGLYISKGYSFIPYFNYEIDDALRIYKKITGQSAQQLNAKLQSL